MTITVESADVLEGSNFIVASSGMTATRIFVMRTDANETAAEVLLDPAIPAHFAQHPDFNTGGTGYYPLYVLSRNAEPAEGQPDLFRVIVEYGQPDAAEKPPAVSPTADDCVIQISSSISTVKTQRDKDGNPIIVTLAGQPDQLGEVEIQTPVLSISFERKEATSAITKAIANDTHVNSVDVGIFAPRTLLCVGIESTSQDNGYSWQITYSFQYKADTWDATVVYIDPETDRPHKNVDLVTHDGELVVEVFQTADFSSLDLPWPV